MNDGRLAGKKGQAQPDALPSPSLDEVAVKRYAVYLCDLCVAGEGGICWTPGCALWAKSAPDVPLKPEPHYVIEELSGE